MADGSTGLLALLSVTNGLRSAQLANQQQAYQQKQAQQNYGLKLLAAQNLADYHDGQIQNGADRNKNGAVRNEYLHDDKYAQHAHSIMADVGNGVITPGAAQTEFQQLNDIYDKGGSVPALAPTAPTPPAYNPVNFGAQLAANLTPSAPAPTYGGLGSLGPAPPVSAPTLPPASAPGIGTQSPGLSPFAPGPKFLSQQAKDQSIVDVNGARLPVLASQAAVNTSRAKNLDANTTQIPLNAHSKRVLEAAQAGQDVMNTQTLPSLRTAQEKALGTNAGANLYRAQVYGQVAPIQAQAAAMNADTNRMNAGTNQGRLAVDQYKALHPNAGKNGEVLPNGLTRQEDDKQQAQYIKNQARLTSLTSGLKGVTDPNVRAQANQEINILNKAQANIQATRSRVLLPPTTALPPPTPGAPTFHYNGYRLTPAQAQAILASRKRGR